MVGEIRGSAVSGAAGCKRYVSISVSPAKAPHKQQGSVYITLHGSDTPAHELAGEHLASLAGGSERPGLRMNCRYQDDESDTSSLGRGCPPSQPYQPLLRGAAQ